MHKGIKGMAQMWERVDAVSAPYSLPTSDHCHSIELQKKKKRQKTALRSSNSLWDLTPKEHNRHSFLGQCPGRVEFQFM